MWVTVIKTYRSDFFNHSLLNIIGREYRGGSLFRYTFPEDEVTRQTCFGIQNYDSLLIRRFVVYFIVNVNKQDLIII